MGDGPQEIGGEAVGEGGDGEGRDAPLEGGKGREGPLEGRGICCGTGITRGRESRGGTGRCRGRGLQL